MFLFLLLDLYRPCRSNVSDNKNFRRSSTARTWSSCLYPRRCSQLHSFCAALGSYTRYTLKICSLFDVSYCYSSFTGRECLFNVYLGGLLRSSHDRSLTTKSEYSVFLILGQKHEISQKRVIFKNWFLLTENLLIVCKNSFLYETQYIYNMRKKN